MRELVIITGWLIGIIGVCGVILNGFLIIFLLFNISSFHPQKLVYLNLAGADFFFAVIACTLRGPGVLVPEIWNIPWICQSGPYLVSFFSKANLLATTPLTASILLITVWGHEACTRTKMFLLCSLSWIIPFLFLLFFTLDGHFHPDHFYVSYSARIGRCDFNGTSHALYYTKIQGPLFFMCPMVFCASLYIVIAVVARRHLVRGLRRIVARGFIVCALYVITWLPFYIANFYKNVISSEVFIATYAMFYFSVIVNPIVYTATSHFFCQRFRSGLKRMWCCPCCGCQDVTVVQLEHNQPYLQDAEGNESIQELGGDKNNETSTMRSSNQDGDY